jgi:ribosomal-protein-alanine N-acetyltransferase
MEDRLAPEELLPPRLHTPRLLLRPVERGDADGIFAYASDPEVARYTLWDPHGSRQDTEFFIEDYALANYRQRVPDPFILESREEPGKILGTVGCHWASELHRTMELGFALAREAWGKGLGTEAAWAVTCFAFSTFRPARLQARCHADNPASARVLEKIGMSHEGLLRAAAIKGTVVWDVHLYALVRRDWQAFLLKERSGAPGRPLAPVAER